MKDYRGILIKELIAISFLIIIIFIVCIVGFIVIRKLMLEKSLYILISFLFIVTIVFGGYYIANISLDLKNNSFETYVGKYSHPERDTLILDEYNKMKLYAIISIPGNSNNATIVYSKRSKIVVGYHLNE